MSNIEQLEKASVVLLGASFTTGNLGVSALAWSSIKVIRTKWPEARIVLFGGRHPGIEKTRMDGSEEFSTWPVRYCPNFLVQNHILSLGIAVFLCRCLPFLKKRLTSNRSTLGELLRCDLVCDITGGDSFSDIYGLKRFFMGYILKRICQMTGKPFILLPQTYGPFKSLIARRLARRVFKHAKTIYSRDQEGLIAVEKMIGTSPTIRLCPDVAFVLDAIRPPSNQTASLENLNEEGQRLIGLNISGLLYYGGYTGDNMFGLVCNYPTLIFEIINHFLNQTNYHLMLVPHVSPSANYAVEDDYLACVEVVKSLSTEMRKRVVVLEKGYDQNETKYFVGLCDFFLGARMHATIAALSQDIPAIGMAYSKKFSGVFETAGVSDCVLDLRRLNNKQILDGVVEIFSRKAELRAKLQKSIPAMQAQILNIFIDN